MLLIRFRRATCNTCRRHLKRFASSHVLQCTTIPLSLYAPAHARKCLSIKFWRDLRPKCWSRVRVLSTCYFHRCLIGIFYTPFGLVSVSCFQSCVARWASLLCMRHQELMSNDDDRLLPDFAVRCRWSQCVSLLFIHNYIAPVSVCA